MYVAVRTLSTVPDALMFCVEAILEHMLYITAYDAQSLGHRPSWEYRWKPLATQDGYDMYRGQWVEYMNRTYRTLLIGLCNTSARILTLVRDLSVGWPSLNPSVHDDAPNPHVIEIQGDVIEIVMM